MMLSLVMLTVMRGKYIVCEGCRMRKANGGLLLLGVVVVLTIAFIVGFDDEEDEMEERI